MSRISSIRKASGSSSAAWRSMNNSVNAACFERQATGLGYAVAEQEPRRIASYCSADIGSMRVARRAGSQAAIVVTVMMANAAKAMTNGSVGSRPKSNDRR